MKPCRHAEMSPRNYSIGPRLLVHSQIKASLEDEKVLLIKRLDQNYSSYSVTDHKRLLSHLSLDLFLHTIVKTFKLMFIKCTA